jgi:PIN domain nuclease of toxin-antitoxin system
LKESFLLDTQTILNIRLGQAIPKKVEKLLADETHIIYLSIASLWEIAIKSANPNALELGISLEEFVESTIVGGIALLEIKPFHLYELQKLPKHHKDPFDRLIIAQAKREGFSIIGKDEKFDRYDIKRIW